MTIEEAIKHFESQAQCNYAPTREAAQMAIAALRAQQVDATPLTLEELREMDGRGVWCDDYRCDGIISVDEYGRWAGIPFLIMRLQGVNCTYNIEDRGLTIYSRKPEEVQHG